jgi:hypothetical protein
LRTSYDVISTAKRLNISTNLRVRFCFRKADDLAALFPLAALFEQLDAFETLQDVPFGDNGAGSSETAVLRHKLENELPS